MVLDKAEIDMAVGVITSIFEVRKPLDEEEVKQLGEALNNFYNKYRS